MRQTGTTHDELDRLSRLMLTAFDARDWTTYGRAVIAYNTVHLALRMSVK